MKRAVIYLILLMTMFSFVSASFKVGEPSHNLTKSIYSIGSSVEGWVNLSFENEAVNSMFEDSEGNTITLIDFLRSDTLLDEGDDYQCSPIDCTPGYTASKGGITKTFNMVYGEKKLLGFKLTDDISSIDSVNFTIHSDSMSSCTNQLSVDFLGDGTDLVNDKALEISCPSLKRYGCFNESAVTEEYTIGAGYYCQRIKLTPSPGFNIGTWIRNESSDGRDIIIEIYEKDGGYIEGASCELPKDEITSDGSEISCDVNYSLIESEDHYVCIHSEGGSLGIYNIKGYGSGESCGFYGSPVQTEDASYKIFAEGRKFAPVGDMEVSDAKFSGEELKTMIEAYIIDKYDSGMDCSDGCVIPFVIEAKGDGSQEIILKNLRIDYTKSTGITHSNTFYELTLSNATVGSSGFQKISLNNGGFDLPHEYGDSYFGLSFKDQELFLEEVNVQMSVINSLKPTTTASAYPTEFEIGINSGNNITKYEWDFGDGHTKNTNTNKVTYTYSSTGEYQLKVTVTDSDDKVSYKTFDVSVGSPADIIDSLLKKKQEDLTNVDSQISKLPRFQKESLSSLLNLSNLNDKLKELQRKYKSGSPEEDFNAIMDELLYLKVPESVRIGKSGSNILFYPSNDNINIDVLQSIEGYDDSLDEDKYKNGIQLWYQGNISAKISFSEFLAKFENQEEHVLSVFEFDITNKDDSTTPYMVLRKLDNLEFGDNYLEKEEGGYTYLELDKSSQTVSFLTTESVDITDLPVFISPPINRIPITENNFYEPEPDTYKWFWFIFIMFLIVIGGIIGYIVLQEWYKRKYENYLFKNRNDLYNLVSYIEVERKKGTKDSQIKTKLRKAGWTSEQVNYSMKKHIGKRTGMLEIPVDKILKKFGKEQQAGNQSKTYGRRFNL